MTFEWSRPSVLTDRGNEDFSLVDDSSVMLSCHTLQRCVRAQLIYVCTFLGRSSKMHTCGKMERCCERVQHFFWRFQKLQGWSYLRISSNWPPNCNIWLFNLHMFIIVPARRALDNTNTCGGSLRTSRRRVRWVYKSFAMSILLDITKRPMKSLKVDTVLIGVPVRGRWNSGALDICYWIYWFSSVNVARTSAPVCSCILSMTYDICQVLWIFWTTTDIIRWTGVLPCVSRTIFLMHSWYSI